MLTWRPATEPLAAGLLASPPVAALPGSGLPFIAALVALVEFIMALYVLVLAGTTSHSPYSPAAYPASSASATTPLGRAASRSRGYLLIALLLFLLSASTFTSGPAPSLGAAWLFNAIHAAAQPAILPVFWLICLYLLRPDLSRRPWRHPLKLAPVLTAIYPALLVILVGIFRAQSPGLGFAPGAGFGLPIGGTAALIVLFLNYLLPWTAALVLLVLHVTRPPAAQVNANTPLIDRRTSLWLLGALLLAGLPILLSGGSLPLPALPALIASTGFLIALSGFAFSTSLSPTAATVPSARPGAARGQAEQLADQHHRARNSLQVRLTALILIVAIPLFAAVTIFLTRQAQSQLEADALQVLQTTNRAVTENTAIWLDYNTKALQTLTKNPNIFNMLAQAQRPVLEEFAATYPDVDLVSTTDLQGQNVARSDGGQPVNYADRRWFQDIVDGAPLAYQALVARTSQTPSLVVSMPIKDVGSNGASRLVGVGMIATQLSVIQHMVANPGLGGGGQVFMVDETGQLIAANDKTRPPLQDLRTHPAVQALLDGQQGLITYRDENNQPWRAVLAQLPNGWGVIAERSEADLFAPIRDLQRQALAILLIGVTLLLSLSWFTIRQGLHPIHSLNDTAAAITAGDFSRLAPVESGDELGLLAQSLNAMILQLRDLIRGLETRVAERTRDLERRLLQLRVTAEVAREAASIHDQDELLQDMAHLISERFGFYHTGLFLIETPGAATSEWDSSSRALVGVEAVPSFAVLKAASSEGGQRMLARRHRLQVGQVGIVGSVAASGRPRIALDVGKDAAFFNNPDLPETRSEMALPLKVQERVMGVLDVQSRKPAAFTDEDVAILQILADQLALAIETTRLLDESNQALRELEALYGMQFSQGWKARLAGRQKAYHFDYRGVTPLATEDPASGEIAGQPSSALETLEAPIELHGRRLGRVRLQRSRQPSPAVTGASEAGWRQDEAQMLHKALEQLALSLENARLLEEIQNRAGQEELINRIISRTQSSLHLETVMRTAALEIGSALNLARLRIRLGDDSQPAGDAAPGVESPQGHFPSNGGAARSNGAGESAQPPGGEGSQA